MNEIIGYYLRTVTATTLSLKKKSVLVEKPWAMLDSSGEVQKFIFKKDNGLILSKNGNVIEGRWEYYAEARSLLIDRGADKILLQEQFIDDNVMILKKDGTSNEFFSLANENTIPSLNVPKYLNELKCTKFNVKTVPLFNGYRLQVHDVFSLNYSGNAIGHKADLIDEDYQNLSVTDGSYLSLDKTKTIYIQDGKVKSVSQNYLQKLSNGSTFEIENGIQETIKNINKKVSLNGEELPDGRMYDSRNVIYEIQNSTIKTIFFPTSYDLKSGGRIVIEQKDYHSIKKGDVIVDAEPDFPLLDGKYKIKGKWRKIKIKNSTIV